jgi:hypothetical protein
MSSMRAGLNYTSRDHSNEQKDSDFKASYPPICRPEGESGMRIPDGAVVEPLRRCAGLHRQAISIKPRWLEFQSLPKAI